MDYGSIIRQTLLQTPVEIWYAIAGAVAVAVISHVLKIPSKLIRRFRHWRMTRTMEVLQSALGGIRIVEFGPSILVDNESVSKCNGEFILPMPVELIASLENRVGFKDSKFRQMNIFGAHDISRLGDILSIEAIESKIDQHYWEVVKEFEEESRGIRFNSELFGVRSFRRSRVGPDEAAYLSLEVFSTDYFTFKIMDKFHRALLATEPEKTLRSFARDDDISNRLYPFLVSVGLNFLLVCADDHVVLTRRSTNLDRFGYPGNPTYPSFNEALTAADCIKTAGRGVVPSIPRCFFRGLDEELGVSESEVAHPVFRLIGFGDVGIGFGVYGYANSRLLSAEVVNRLAGRDRAFESSEVFSVPLTRRALRKIISAKDTSLQVKALLRALAVDRGIRGI